MCFSRFSCCASLLLAFHFCSPSPLQAQFDGLPNKNVESWRPGSTSLLRALPIFNNLTATNPVERVLASRVTLQIDDMTMQEFAQTLRERFKINVLVDTRALDDVGLGTDTPMKGIQVERVELETVINVLLERLDLCFYLRDHILIITTPEEAENNLSTNVYPVGDLLDVVFGYPGDPQLYADYDTLIETITSSLAPDTWDEVGGAGSIEPYPYSQSLVISQTRDVHKQIQALLDTLRKARSRQPAPRNIGPGTRRSGMGGGMGDYMGGSVGGNVGSIPYRPGSTPAGNPGAGSHPANMGGHF